MNSMDRSTIRPTSQVSRSSSILVTGGAGYIGSNMVRVLQRAGYRPVVLDNLSTGHRNFLPRGVKFIKGDLRRPADLERAFSSQHIDAVMHFAASALVGESVRDPLKYYDNNVLGFIGLAWAMRKYHVKRFIQSSTCAVYGEPKSLPLKENAPTAPTNPYGMSKLIIEMMLKDLARAGQIEFIALRYFNACGACESAEVGELHDPETHLIPIVLEAAAGRLKKVTVFGTDYPTPDGTCVRDYVHVDDLCRAHLLALKALGRGVKNEAFNLGNGKGYSVKDIIQTAENVTARKIRVVIAKRRPGDPAKLVASYAKARRMLGWEPKCDLETIMRTAWRWHERG